MSRFTRGYHTKQEYGEQVEVFCYHEVYKFDIFIYFRIT